MSIDLQFLLNSLANLNKILTKIVNNSKIVKLVSKLEQIFSVFQEIRWILGQEGKSGKEIKSEIKQLVKSLKSNDIPIIVYKVVKKRFKMYDKELYVSYDNEFVPRTNNDLEDFNNRLKRPIRKGQGRKDSWFYIEHQGEPSTYYHNLLNAPHVVGGTEISWSSEKTPFERIGVLHKITVSEIMNLIKREYFFTSLSKNNELYTTHRWTRRIFKQGLEKCLNSLNSEWISLIENIISKNKSIIGGATSSS